MFILTHGAIRCSCYEKCSLNTFQNVTKNFSPNPTSIIFSSSFSASFFLLSGKIARNLQKLGLNSWEIPLHRPRDSRKPRPLSPKFSSSNAEPSRVFCSHHLSSLSPFRTSRRAHTPGGTKAHSNKKPKRKLCGCTAVVTSFTLASRRTQPLLRVLPPCAAQPASRSRSARRYRGPGTA